MLRQALIGLLVLAMGAAGLALLAGGVLLISIGGSAYYAVAGAALTACAFGLWRKRAWAIPLYGLILVGTLIWALLEAGFDGWALVPRLVAPTVLGLILLIPAVRRRSDGARPSWLLAPIALIILAFAGAAVPEMMAKYGPGAALLQAADTQNGEWRTYGRTLAGDRFCPLSAINTGNVAGLKPAWEFTSDVEPMGFHSFEATPLAVNGKLYICLERDVIVALDQDSGRQIWRFNAKSNLEGVFAATCRGVAYYQAPEGTPDCPRRILFGAHDNRLIAVDADTGRLCPSFGKAGIIDLKEGLGAFAPGIAFPTSAPTVVNGVAITSGWVTDGVSTNEPSGAIRGFDAVTGALRWAWDYARPEPQKPLGSGETYTRGAPNAWGAFSGDEALNLVYVPTGVSTPDYFGAHRTPAAETFATGVVALDATTGKPRWHFQTVHHDIWDFDVGSQPVLTDIAVRQAHLPALVLPTKRGQFFVLDRRTGSPIYPVTEKPVPQGAAKGDWASKTQPYSSFPNVAGPPLSEAGMWGVTPLDQLWCRIQFKQARYEGDFTPPGVKTAIHYPGSAGGSNWGSVTIDTARGIMITNSLYMADIGRLVPRDEVNRMKYSKGTQADAFGFPQEGTPYAMKRSVFLNPLGVPCQQPPYGRLTAINLATGKVVWSKPLGTAKHAGPLGLSSYLPIRMGVPNLGGSLATAGGVVFIGATQDRTLRAIDIGNGKELWSAALPAIGAATPMTYRSPKTGRQYVVIAAGGHPGLPGPFAGKLIGLCAEMNMDRFAVGKAEIRRVEELRAPMPLAMFNAPELVERNADWLFPLWADADGNWDMVVQSWIMMVDDRVVVVDPCVGNGRPLPGFPLFDMLDTPFIERFAATGIRPEDVDCVFCTHLHSDHCGWNTTLRDGRFVPTFPNARYLMSQREFDRWDNRRPGYQPTHANEGIFDRSVLPVLEAGLAELIADGHQISPSLQAEGTPGHTLGHTALHLASAGREAWFTGDVFHHPIELIHPEIDANTCEDFDQTLRTRRRLVQRIVDTGALVIPAHFAEPHVGFVREENGRRRFEPLAVEKA